MQHPELRSNHYNIFWYHCQNPKITAFCHELLSFGGPCNFHPFLGKWRLSTSHCYQPHTAVQPCVGGSRYGLSSGQSADFIWQWTHSRVRCLNKNAFVKPSLQWNIQVLIFFSQVRQGKLLSGLSVYVTVAALLWPFLFTNPLRAVISILFHMHATEVGTPTTQQNKSSTVRAAHSWASDITWSTVRPLCFPCFTPSLTEEKDRERTSESKTCACPTWMLMVSSEFVRLLLCVFAHVWGEMSTSDRGQHFFPFSPRLTCRMWEAGGALKCFTHLSADCEGLRVNREIDFWLQVWDWTKQK